MSRQQPPTAINIQVALVMGFCPEQISVDACSKLRYILRSSTHTCDPVQGTVPAQRLYVLLLCNSLTTLTNVKAKVLAHSYMPAQMMSQLHLSQSKTRHSKGATPGAVNPAAHLPRLHGKTRQATLLAQPQHHDVDVAGDAESAQLAQQECQAISQVTDSKPGSQAHLVACIRLAQIQVTSFAQSGLAACKTICQ